MFNHLVAFHEVPSQLIKSNLNGDDTIFEKLVQLKNFKIFWNRTSHEYQTLWGNRSIATWSISQIHWELIELGNIFAINTQSLLNIE